VAFALGQSNEVTGTGVFNNFMMMRDADGKVFMGDAAKEELKKKKK
jgi:hypothetical protein